MSTETDRLSKDLESSQEADYLLTSDDLKDETSKKETQSLLRTRWLLAIIGIYTIFFITLYLAWNPSRPSCNTESMTGLFPPHHGKEYTIEDTSCGDNVDTALARNCIFDPTGNNWVPKLCYNSRLADEAVHGSTKLANMLGLEELSWYMDQNMTQYVPTDELGDALAKKIQSGGDPVAYVTEKWHVAHCMYMMSTAVEVAHRVALGERDVWIHHTMINSHHATHCAEVIGNHHRREHGTSEVEFGYTHCKKIA